MYKFSRDLNDDWDGTELTSFLVEIDKKEARENKENVESFLTLCRLIDTIVVTCRKCGNTNKLF